MALPRARMPASRRALAMLVGVLAFGTAFFSLHTGSVRAADDDMVCTSLLDVFLVIDESGSIGSTNYNKVRTFVSDFIKSMPVSPEDVRIGLVTYSTSAVERWNLSDSKATNPAVGSTAALALPYAAGLTYTNEALDMAKKLIYDVSKGARADVPKLVLVMTDGVSNVPAKTKTAADELRNLGAIIVVLGVGSGANQTECRNIAGCPTADCPKFLQTDWTAVTAQVNSIIKAACKELAKDAVCSDWSDYGPCEGECGKEGVRKSHRTEITPQKPGTPPCPTCSAPQGRSCANQSPGLVRTQPCTMPVCKVDAGCGEFLPWSDWSTTCGTATRTRHREPYNSPQASGGGLSCPEQNPPKLKTEVETVDKAPCPVQQQPGPWSEWSECSTTCGGGERHRQRQGLPQEGELYGGQNLEAQGIAVRESQTCNENPCPINATCGDWTEYEVCSKTCGGGTQERRRQPWMDNAKHGGLQCIEQHPEGQTSLRECNTQPCPVDEIPGEWGPWGPCSEQCGPGTQSRHREKSLQEAMHGGLTIQEQNVKLPPDEQILLVETRNCENNPCEWTSCPACPGTRTRHTMVLFDYYDGKCNTNTSEVESCEGHCPLPTTPPGGGEGEAGGAGGEEGKEEASGFPTAAVAGGVAGGLLILAAAGGGAAYGMGGAGGGAIPEAGTEVLAEQGPGAATEQERESLISAGEQTEMWAA